MIDCLAPEKPLPLDQPLTTDLAAELWRYHRSCAHNCRTARALVHIFIATGEFPKGFRVHTYSDLDNGRTVTPMREL